MYPVPLLKFPIHMWVVQKPAPDPVVFVEPGGVGVEVGPGAGLPTSWELAYALASSCVYESTAFLGERDVDASRQRAADAPDKTAAEQARNRVVLARSRAMDLDRLASCGVLCRQVVPVEDVLSEATRGRRVSHDFVSQLRCWNWFGFEGAVVPETHAWPSGASLQETVAPGSGCCAGLLGAAT